MASSDVFFGKAVAFLCELYKFIKVVVEHATHKRTIEIHCPCGRCNNEVLFDNAEIMRSHLVEHGFVMRYTQRTRHGEGHDDTNARHVADVEVTTETTTCHTHRGDTSVGYLGADGKVEFDVVELFRHVEPRVLMSTTSKGLDNFETPQKASKDFLYEGCPKEFPVFGTSSNS